MSLELLKEQIKESPISLVIGQYITLNKKGANLEAICPFHSDTKPSLKVNDSKGMYKCFACGAGGDAITFVKEYKHIDFLEAMKEIAKILGLHFEEYQKEKKKNPKIEMAHRVLNASAKIYKKVADSNQENFIDFVQKRKLSQESLERFQIGYAPGNNAFYHYLDSIPSTDRDFALKVAQEIGIVRFNENRQSFYDFYRDRVMFPIHDHSGQIRGYSSRAVLKDQNPKYLNSGESFAFDKGAILFGYYFAKNAIRQKNQVIIVEGNMDVIMMHQFGIDQTVGTMGTALSEHSIKLLSNMTKNVYLGMDSDEAGKKAMKRINADFMNQHILPRYLSFAPHKDPDEFLLQEGQLALIERIEKSPILLDTLIEELIPGKIPETLEQKLKLLNLLFELLAPLKDELAATERIMEFSRKLGLKSDPASILESYKEFLSKIKVHTPAPVERQKIQDSEEKILEIEKEAQKLQGNSSIKLDIPLSKSEKIFLKEIISHPEFITHISKDDFLATIGHDEVKKLVQWLVKIYLEIEDSEYVSIVQDELQYGNYNKEIIKVGTEALFNHGTKYGDRVIEKMWKDFKVILKMDQLKNLRKNLVERQKSSQTQNEVDFVLSEISKLDKEMLNLKNSAL